MTSKPNPTPVTSPVSIPLARPERGGVLVFAPHPDDEVLGCGGTLALHAEQGDAVHVTVVFDGATGDVTGAWDPDLLARRRRDEALAGGRALAQDNVGFRYDFWEQPEGHEPTDEELADAAERMVSCAAAVGARTIYAPWAGDAHPDHRAVARALGLALNHADWPTSVEFVWGFEVWTPLAPARVIDVGRTIELKRTALACHATQSAGFGLEPGSPLIHRALGLGAYRSQLVGPDARYAEAFCRFEAPAAQPLRDTAHQASSEGEAA